MNSLPESLTVKKRNPMTANREYKDTVFSRLFTNPDALRELYGAISGTPLPPETPVLINTLKDVLFKGRMNDISFIVGGVLVVLIEHQSTINENMPLRL
ncbi:MAG: Rpn family recombination-promoting nuclease/putative transposase, partial [Treponema sp.]|nr:Rpn family recombination-promoting nuclease/putative transposase [Treponema sp.]